jgi:hypothetical protein
MLSQTTVLVPSPYRYCQFHLPSCVLAVSYLSCCSGELAKCISFDITSGAYEFAMQA